MDDYSEGGETLTAVVFGDAWGIVVGDVHPGLELVATKYILVLMKRKKPSWINYLI